MTLTISIVVLVVGFVMLIKGADIFVDASVNIAKRFGLPDIIIGLTIIAMGTAAPEIVIGVSDAIGGYGHISTGLVVGSNMFNLLFVIGVVALIKPIDVRVREIARDYWVSVIPIVLLIVMKIVFVDTIPRAGSLVLLLGFFFYLFVLIRQVVKGNKSGDVMAIELEQNDNPVALTPPTQSKPLWRSILFALLGVAVIIAGGQMAVNSAVEIASVLGISQRIIGMTILAAGTSMPELVISLMACKKGKSGIAIGNVIGSNVVNLLFVLGLTGVIMPLSIDTNTVFDLGVLLVGSLIFLLFAYTGKKLVRFEGLLLVLIYCAYMLFAIV